MSTFKTRARTLDMLGRQQIAGIPTAISELFKNAHDAYASCVEIDYYRSDGLFVLRDDGTGMSRDEFIARWLTIGTESRLQAAPKSLSPQDAAKAVRPMLGEKGIGRLAIATIGPQVLVLTRSRRGPMLSDLTAAFVNWSIFECPGINLDDVQVAIRTFPGGELPSKMEVSQMVAEFREQNGRLTSGAGEDFRSRIDSELQQFDMDPRRIDMYLGEPSLSGEGSGTHFIIMPSSDLLPMDIDGDGVIDKATPLTKALLGFTNTMVPGHPEPVIRAAFRDHKTDEVPDDLITDGEFFTPEEFENADHNVTGKFDAYGQFKGDISIYGEVVEDHVIPWRGAGGGQTACGPFAISFAAIEADGKHSTLPPEDHARMTYKTRKIGGLYIYRDGVRVLPYGNTDYDWLDIEVHRTKSAYYYYFSHRKMFGVVEIDSVNNQGLSEKAGREGFRENRAYRQFKGILKTFLGQMAADFFRREGVYGEKFQGRKEELEKIERDRRRREEHASMKKSKFGGDLKAFFDRVDSNAPAREATDLQEDVSKRIAAACEIADADRAATEILNVENYARSELRNLHARYKIARPRVGLSKAMQKEWGDYRVALAQLETDVFVPARKSIDRIIGACVADARVEVDRRRRATAALDALGREAMQRTRKYGAGARQEAERVSAEVRDAASESIREVSAVLRTAVGEFQRMDLSSATDGEFLTARDSYELRILEVVEDRTGLLESLVAQLETIDVSGETSALDQLAAVEQRNVSLEEQVEADLQLAQLGTAVEIINHEFNATVRSIRNNLRRLKAWADVNEEIEGLYRNIRASFDHLDGYLTLFTPLHRRLYRKPIDIRGADIFEFLRDLFRERFARHEVDFGCTQAFSRATIRAFPSSFYPVFVNLVDNALYWLSQQNPGVVRRLEIDATAEGFLVSDTGPGVNARDGESVFEFGFTRKPGGRGMGLHISRETLRRVDYDLVLGDRGSDHGAVFIIKPRGAEQGVKGGN